jgi:hypothetical protein
MKVKNNSESQSVAGLEELLEVFELLEEANL